MMKITSLFFVLLALVGCATSTGVVPMGNGTYMIGKSDSGPASSLGAIKAESLREAQAFCKDKGGDFEVISSNDTPRSFGQFPQSSTQFRCIAK